MAAIWDISQEVSTKKTGPFPISQPVNFADKTGMDPTNIRQRILDEIEAQQLSVAEAARRAGVKYDVIRDMKRGKALSTSWEKTVKIAAALGIDTSGMVDEDGPLAIVPRVVNPGDGIDDGEVLVNVWDVEARAGHGAVVPEYEAIAYKLAFPPNYLRSITSVDPSNLEIITVKGKSMLPTLDDDDIVMVDRSKTRLGYDGVFVMRFEDTLHVKRVMRGSAEGMVRIWSDNKDNYPAFERRANDIDVIGKVVWAGKKM